MLYYSRRSKKFSNYKTYINKTSRAEISNAVYNLSILQILEKAIASYL